jgi:hypothetical protein
MVISVAECFKHGKKILVPKKTEKLSSLAKNLSGYQEVLRFV